MKAVSTLAIVLAGCGAAEQAPPAPKVPPNLQQVPTASSGFEPYLLDVARAYRGFGRVDDETRWAPYLCREPMPSRARFSASPEEGTHGRKLYYVFARHREDYVSGTRSIQGSGDRLPQPTGQVLVKESWKPEDAGAAPTAPSPWDFDRNQVLRDEGVHVLQGGSRIPLAWKDGRLYRAAEPAGLFVMFKTAPGTPDSDEGWVYGTMSADLKRVTSSGRVTSCMACHAKAPHDRLFGFPAGR